jgi:hypothetical protein
MAGIEFRVPNPITIPVLLFQNGNNGIRPLNTKHYTHCDSHFVIFLCLKVSVCMHALNIHSNIVNDIMLCSLAANEVLKEHNTS